MFQKKTEKLGTATGATTLAVASHQRMASCQRQAQLDSWKTEVERTSGQPSAAGGVAATEAARPGGTTPLEKTDRDSKRPTGT